MATVYRGVKSRVVGLLYGVLWIAIAAGVTYVLGVPGVSPGVRELAPYALPALVALFGLFNVGKALLQDDYRIIVNYHRQDLNVQFGHKFFS